MINSSDTMLGAIKNPRELINALRAHKQDSENNKDDNYDTEDNENEDKNDTATEKGNQHEPSKANISNIIAEIEKMKGHMEYVKEVQKTSDERFTRINEEVGELRSMILEREKQGKTMEAEVTKAIDIVREVQPEKFYESLKKKDAKIEALIAKVESNETFYDGLSKEVGTMRNQMSVFRGLESVMKLNKEMETTYINTKKIQGIIEHHSDKVENLFMTIQKKFTKLQKFIDNVSEIEESVKGIVKDINNLSVKMSETVNKSVIDDLEQKMNDKIRQISKFTDNPDEIFKNIDQISKKLDDLVPLKSDVNSFKTDINEKLLKIDKTLCFVDNSNQKIDALETKINHLSQVLSEFEQTKSEMIELLSNDKDIMIQLSEEIDNQKKMLPSLISRYTIPKEIQNEKPYLGRSPEYRKTKKNNVDASIEVLNPDRNKQLTSLQRDADDDCIVTNICSLINDAEDLIEHKKYYETRDVYVKIKRLYSKLSVEQKTKLHNQILHLFNRIQTLAKANPNTSNFDSQELEL